MAKISAKTTAELEYDLEMADQWTRGRGLARIPEKLDRRAFEKIAKATPIDFVVEKKVPRVTISTDLERVLSKAVQ